MDAAPNGTDVLEHEVRVAAAPETVFEYFTDPARLVRWMGEEATLDPRPGGVCRIVIGGTAMLGRYVEVVPPSRVVFSWGWEARLFAVGPESTLVEVVLTPDGDGTHVRLTHRRLPEPAHEFHTAGWGHFVARLRIAAAGGEPRQDGWVDTEGRRLAARGTM